MKPEGAPQRKGSNYSDVLHTTENDLNPLPPQSGYRFSVVKTLLIYPLAILPLGAGLLLAYWYRARWVRLTYSPCPLSMATTVVMSDAYGQQRVCRVQVATFPNVHNADDTIEITARTVRYLTHCRLRYLYSSDEEKFVLLSGHDHGRTLAGIHESITGLSDWEYEQSWYKEGEKWAGGAAKPVWSGLEGVVVCHTEDNTTALYTKTPTSSAEYYWHH